jgi:hypothetical protein
VSTRGFVPRRLEPRVMMSSRSRVPRVRRRNSPMASSATATPSFPTEGGSACASKPFSPISSCWSTIGSRPLARLRAKFGSSFAEAITGRRRARVGAAPLLLVCAVGGPTSFGGLTGRGAGRLFPP